VVPNCRDLGPAQAAQRKCLRSFHAELADKGVYLGRLYIGATIEDSALHTSRADDPDGGGRWGPTPTAISASSTPIPANSSANSP
jgi:hypothetical protein